MSSITSFAKLLVLGMIAIGKDDRSVVISETLRFGNGLVLGLTYAGDYDAQRSA
jgi:hypothetical protein